MLNSYYKMLETVKLTLPQPNSAILILAYTACLDRPKMTWK